MHEKPSVADVDVGHAFPHAPQLSMSRRMFTSHGKREFGQVVQPAGHLFDGQYVTCVGAVTSSVAASGLVKLTVPASMVSAMTVGDTPQPPSQAKAAVDAKSPSVIVDHESAGDGNTRG